MSPDKKSVMMGPHLPLILSLIECANKGCINQYDRMFKSNFVLLTSFCNNWLMKLNVEIAFVKVQNLCITSGRTTPYKFLRFIYFKTINQKVMTNTIYIK